MPFVLDASIAAVWAFADESHPIAERILSGWMIDPAQQDLAYVPVLWWFEIRNVLAVNERRKRIAESETDEFLRIAASFPIEEDEYRDEAETLRLTRDFQLSFYDAAYLELAFAGERRWQHLTKLCAGRLSKRASLL